MTIGAPATGEAPGAAMFHRRDVFIWVVTILFANQVFGVIAALPSSSLATVVSDLGTIGIFQYMAWYAVFRLLRDSDGEAPAESRDFIIAVVLCLLVFMPTDRMIWVAADGLAIYLWVFYGRAATLRSAATVLVAMSVQAFWGHVFFHLVAYDLLRAETAVVGTLLRATRSGIDWQDNVISSADGFGIAIYTGCSSFFNLSLAMLCWITLTKLQRPFWRRSDFVVGAVVGGSMILLNLARLYVMALNIDLYYYWHDGPGAEIFAVVASLMILVVSLYGTNRVARST
jgi:hypothetical protein